MLTIPFPIRLAAMLVSCTLLCDTSWAATTHPKPALTQTASSKEDVVLYRTREGDTLINLSQRYLLQPQDWPRLAQLNQIANPRRMPVGTEVRIPVAWLKPTPRSGEILAAVGDAVVMQPGESSRPARPGDLLPPGSLVRTASNGYVTVRLADGSVLRIQADTEARLETSKQYEQAGFFASVWEVLRGRVEALVTHLTGGEPRFQIKTPQAVLGVRGTVFRVEADATQGVTRDETLEGAVGARTAGPETLVKAGFGTVVDQDKKVLPPVALLPAPNLQGLPTLQERILVRFNLPAVAHAVAYRGQVATDADFREVRGEVISSEPVLRFNDLPDGAYFLRARAVDARGLQGAEAIHRFTLKARPEAPIPSSPATGSKWRSKTVPLAWASHPNAQAYRVQVSLLGQPQQLLVDRDDLHDTRLDVALPPGDYQWRVATTATGQDKGPWGDVRTFLVRPRPPTPPAPQADDERIRLTLPGEPGQSFDVQLANEPTFATPLHAIHSDSPDIVLPRPQEGGTWLIRYRAIDADGYIGPWSASQTLALPACIRSGQGACIDSGAGRFMVSPL